MDARLNALENAGKINTNLVEDSNKKSAFKRLALLFTITGVLAYAHKLPIISQIVTMLSLWYGKTTWWGIMVGLRKFFIVCNAMIGVYVVLKHSIYNADTFFAGLAIMGQTYFEMFIATVTRLFKWLFSLFDFFTPDVPKPQPKFYNQWSWDTLQQNDKLWKWGYGWHMRPMTDGIGAHAVDLFESLKSSKSTTSSDWSIPSWLW